MAKQDAPMQIYPQKCYDCKRELPSGEEAVASLDYPLAFCVPCRGGQMAKNRRLIKAVVKDESSG